MVPRRLARLPLHASVPTAGQDELHQLAADGETTAAGSVRRVFINDCDWLMCSHVTAVLLL